MRSTARSRSFAIWVSISATAPSVIETITKVGYRMSVCGPDGSPDPSSADRSLASRESSEDWRGSRRSILAAGAVASIAGAVGLGYHFLRPDPIDARVADLVARSDQAVRNALPDSDEQGVGFLEEAVALRPDSKLALGPPRACAGNRRRACPARTNGGRSGWHAGRRTARARAPAEAGRRPCRAGFASALLRRLARGRAPDERRARDLPGRIWRSGTLGASCTSP